MVRQSLVTSGRRPVVDCDLAGWLPIGHRTPAVRKKKTPTPSQKKSLPDQNSHPVMGDCAARAVGEPISSCDPKNGSIVTDHPDSEVAFDYGVL